MKRKNAFRVVGAIALLASLRHDESISNGVIILLASIMAAKYPNFRQFFEAGNTYYDAVSRAVNAEGYAVLNSTDEEGNYIITIVGNGSVRFVFKHEKSEKHEKSKKHKNEDDYRFLFAELEA